MVSAVVVVALLSIGASPAEQAKQAYEKAIKYSNAGEYEAALPYFEKAYELSKHRPSTIIALAQCERALKKYEQSIAHFKEYLALKPAPKDADKIAETVGLLEDLRNQELARIEREKKAEEAKAPPPRVEVAAVPPPPPPPEVAMVPPPAPPPPVLTTSEVPVEPEDDSIWTSPIFWGVTAGVVVAAGTGVALGVALSPDPEIYGGTTGIVLSN